MITGIDYILYTDKSKDAFIEKIKESVTFWEDPYIVIDNEDETPEGIKITRFRKMIRYWVRIEEQNGPDALKHLGNNKVWTPEAKYELVAKVLAGQSNKSVAISAGISDGMLYMWVRKYKKLGYNGLVNTTARLISGSCISWITELRHTEPLDISSMKYFKIRLKTFLTTSIMLSLTRSM